MGTVERVPYRHLLTCPTIVATCCAGFASYRGLALGLTWFTSYLVDGLGYSQTMGGNLTILPWVFGMCVVLAGGWLSASSVRPVPHPSRRYLLPWRADQGLQLGPQGRQRSEAAWLHPRQP